jgi:protein phosphatase 1G
MGGYLSEPITEVHSEAGRARENERAGGTKLEFAAGAMQGWRKTMEDAHVLETDLGGGLAVFGVFDGHGGHEVAAYVAAHVVEELRYQLSTAGASSSEDKPEDAKSAEERVDLRGLALKRTFLSLDEQLLHPAAQQELRRHRGSARVGTGGDDQQLMMMAAALRMKKKQAGKPVNPQELVSELAVLKRMHQQRTRRPSMDVDPDIVATDLAGSAGATAENVGTTAVVVLLGDDGEFVCANAGDSRAVLCRSGRAIDLSTDHKPGMQSERRRIEAAGGTVTTQNAAGRTVHRVNGSLSLSRALGDFAHKGTPGLSPEQQAVTAAPELLRHTRAVDDEFIVIACDGIWDVKSSQEVCTFVRARLRKGLELTHIIRQLFGSCLSPNPKTTGGLGCDNMTCVIVLLKDPPPKVGWLSNLGASALFCRCGFVSLKKQHPEQIEQTADRREEDT